MKEEANENLHVGRVIYGAAATENRHRLVIETAAQITSQVAWANRSLVKEVRPSSYLVAMAREVIASQLIWNCLTAKHEEFANEQEVQYIIMNVTAKFERHRKNFGGRWYVETPLPLKKPGSIMQILAGPNTPPDSETRNSGFPTMHDYPACIRVRRSTAILS